MSQQLQRVSVWDLRTGWRLHRIAWKRAVSITRPIPRARVLSALAVHVVTGGILLTGAAAHLTAAADMASTLGPAIPLAGFALVLGVSLLAAGPGSSLLAALVGATCWTNDSRTAFAFVRRGRRGTVLLYSHFALAGHGAGFREALARDLLATGVTLRIRPANNDVKTLYLNQLAASPDIQARPGRRRTLLINGSPDRDRPLLSE